MKNQKFLSLGKVEMNTTTFLAFVMLQGIISTILPTDTEDLPVLGIMTKQILPRKKNLENPTILREPLLRILLLVE